MSSILLSHFRQRLSRSSHADHSTRARNSVSVPNNQNETTVENTEKSSVVKNNQTDSINIENLLAMKRTLSPVRVAEHRYSEDFMKEDNPLKKRVKQYFKKHEIVSLQHKLMVLAPGTAALNSANLTQPRGDPSNLKPFLLMPYEKTFGFEKQFSPANNTRRESMKWPSRIRKVSNHNILSTEEDKSPKQKPNETSTKWDRFLRNRGSATSQAKNTDHPKVASIRASSYGDVDAETVGTYSHVDDSLQNLPDVFENPRYWLDYPTRKNSRPDSGETNLNFRVTKISRPRYLDTSEEDVLSKEGSLMKYFRTKNSKTRPTSTKRPSEIRPKTQGNNTVANQTMHHNNSRKDETDNRAQSARIDLKSRRTTTAQHKRRGVDVSMEQSSINASTIAVNTPAQSRGDETSALSSVDLFTKKVKKHISHTKENTIMLSTMFAARGSMESRRSLPLREESPSSANKQQQDAPAPAQKTFYSNKQHLEEEVEEIPEDKFEEIMERALEARARHMGGEPEIIQEINEANDAIGSIEAIETLSDLTKDNEGGRNDNDEEALFVKESPFSKEMGNLIFYSRQQRAKLAVDSLVSDFHETERRRLVENNEETDPFEHADKVWNQGGLVQNKIRPTATFGNSIFMNEGKEDVQEIQSKVGALTTTLKATIDSKEKLYKTMHTNMDKVQLQVSSKLTTNELNSLRQIYAKPSRNDADVEKIDDFLIRLKFFAQLTKEVRLQFLKAAKYIKEQRGKYVFHQGDEGDLMYVILRGSVNVKIKKAFKSGQAQFVSVNSLYDGHHFGELAITELDLSPTRETKFDFTTTEESIEGTEPGDSPKQKQQQDTQRRFMKINELITDHHDKKVSKIQRALNQRNEANSKVPQKRAASIQCSEDTEFLALDRNKFREILASVMNQELDAKIQVLQLIPFFQNCDNLTLLPLATNMKTQIFKLGQRIIKTDDVVMNYYIVSQGRCQVVKEIIEETENVEVLRQTMRNFQFRDFKNSEENSNLVRDSLVRSEQRDKQRGRGASNPMRRTFHQEPLVAQEATANSKRYSSTPKYRKFKAHVVCKEFSRGDHFGFKPLLGPEKDLVYASNKQNRALLSVVTNQI